jgi:hypothetical protein
MTALLPFAHRIPTNEELEKLRLILSTYQDGTGMLAIEGSNATLPGWRDFERSVAFALGGICAESKAVFDVVLSENDNKDAVKYGISCKMRGELNRILNRDGRVTMEISNSNSKFWDHLAKQDIDHQNYMNRAEEVGVAITELVHSWHTAESKLLNIDLEHSCYLVLSYDKQGQYQLHKYPLTLIDPYKLEWSYPVSKHGVSRLVGNDGQGNLVEWFMNSGAQLKYFPPKEQAIWESEIFRLEPLTSVTEGIVRKAEAYFPELWSATLNEQTD